MKNNSFEKINNSQQNTPDGNDKGFERTAAAAKVVRILTLPTLLFFALVSVLYYMHGDWFAVRGSLLVPVLCIGAFPTLAYPASWIFARGENVRKLQRKLAFVFSGIGYLTAFVLVAVLKPHEEITLLVTTYFLSLVILSALNAFGLRASGHACGTAGPLAFLCYRVHPLFFFPCLLIFVLSMWASLKLNRHTAKEFLSGSLSSVIALLISALFIII